MLGNIIVFLIIAAIIGGAAVKIIKDKKKGSGCASCPYNSGCSTKDACPTQSIQTLQVDKELDKELPSDHD